jgi:SH3-like domain-containing protein
MNTFRFAFVESEQARKGFPMTGAIRWMALAAAAGMLAVSAPAQPAPTAMSVQVKSGQLRATASYLGKPVAAVAYGDRVTVVQKQGEWYEVRTTGGETGWLHQSALTVKRVALKAGATDVQATASGEELALAGKGFNSQVEADFKKRNPTINFGPIDAMEKIKVSPQQAAEFLQEGGVAP